MEQAKKGDVLYYDFPVFIFAQNETYSWPFRHPQHQALVTAIPILIL